MNILFLIFHGLSEASGISKKIRYQIDGLRACGHKVFLCHYEIQKNGNRIRMIDDNMLENYGKSKIAPIRKRICYDAINHFAINQNIELVYVRSFHNANPFTIRLFRKLKQAGIKVVMEIPTYPYDQEYPRLPLSWKIELKMDQCFRKKLAKTCNRIVTFSEHQEIFGQQTVQISNGIDFNSTPLRKISETSSTNIHLIAVAEIHYWHGYDRILEGLGLYYRTSPIQKVFLHLIGGIGTVENNIFLTSIQKYHIEPYVFLYGQKQGKELDEIFDQCDFAIGSLGRHRSGINKIKTLKNREYAARGIPFIYSETDDDFEDMPYILKAPADDSPINIQQIIHFIHTLKINPQDIRNSIQHLSWQHQMQKVIDDIFPENNNKQKPMK